MYCLGAHEIHYALRIGGTGENDRRAAEAARGLRMPADVVAPYVRTDGALLPETDSFVKLQTENAAVTAMYLDGEDVVLRLYETDGNACEAAVTLPACVVCAVSTNLIGEPDGRAVTVDGKNVKFALGAHEIVTIRIRF